MSHPEFFSNLKYSYRLFCKLRQRAAALCRSLGCPQQTFFLPLRLLQEKMDEEWGDPMLFTGRYWMKEPGEGSEGG